MPPGNRHFRHLERHVSGMTNNLRPNLDQLLAQRCQGLVPNALWQGQPPEEVGEVVRQSEQLQPHLVGDEAVTGQPRPLQSILSLFDPLLGGAATVVESDHSILRSRVHVGGDKPDAGEQFVPVPLHFGDHTTIAVPAFGVVQEDPIPDDGFLRRPSHRSGQQVADLMVQHVIGWEADGVLVTLLFQKLVKLRLGERGIIEVYYSL